LTLRAYDLSVEIMYPMQSGSTSILAEIREEYAHAPQMGG